MSETKNETTKAVTNSVTDIAVFNDMFGDIDFSSLNKSVESLANASKELSEEEKHAANGILLEWESNVLNRLGDRKDDVDNFLSFLTGKDYYSYSYRSFEDEVGLNALAELADKTKTTELFEAYVNSKEEYDSISLLSPEEPIDDITASYEEKELERREYELTRTKYEISRKKAKRKVVLTRRDWLKAVVSTDEVKELMKNLIAYKRKLSKFKGDCKAKSQNARLNVAISSKEAREALKDLLDFAIDI